MDGFLDHVCDEWEKGMDLEGILASCDKQGYFAHTPPEARAKMVEQVLLDNGLSPHRRRLTQHVGKEWEAGGVGGVSGITRRAVRDGIFKGMGCPDGGSPVNWRRNLVREISRDMGRPVGRGGYTNRAGGPSDPVACMERLDRFVVAQIEAGNTRIVSVTREAHLKGMFHGLDKGGANWKRKLVSGIMARHR